MSTGGCGKPVDYYVAKGYGVKKLAYKCGNTGIDGYPVLCEKCAATFSPADYRREVEEAGERIDDDY